MTTEQKHTITIPGLPEGWRAVAYREPVEGEYYMMEGIHLHGTGRCEEMLIVEKTRPRRIEETNENWHLEKYDGYVVIPANEFINYIDIEDCPSYKIWRVVEEGG